VLPSEAPKLYREYGFDIMDIINAATSEMGETRVNGRIKNVRMEGESPTISMYPPMLPKIKKYAI